MEAGFFFRRKHVTNVRLGWLRKLEKERSIARTPHCLLLRTTLERLAGTGLGNDEDAIRFQQIRPVGTARSAQPYQRRHLVDLFNLVIGYIEKNALHRSHRVVG